MIKDKKTESFEHSDTFSLSFSFSLCPSDINTKHVKAGEEAEHTLSLSLVCSNKKVVE